MISRDEIVGVILAGGQSRRMGGGDKGLLPVAGRPMIAHVIERLRPQVDRVVINANGDVGRFASLALPVVSDTVEGYVGPLAGVLTGMRWAIVNAPDARFIATVSSDAPLAPPNLVRELSAAVSASGRGGIALARSGAEIHPVIGLWPVHLADDLEEALRSGVRKVLHWTDRHGTLPVDFAMVSMRGRAVDPFFNANTPDELNELRRLLEG